MIVFSNLFRQTAFKPKLMLMGKGKYPTQNSILHKLNTKIQKNRYTKKQLASFSTSNISEASLKRRRRVIQSVKNALKKLINKNKQVNQKRLMSVLNIDSQKQIICSAMNIPSIENMVISKNQLHSLSKYDYNYDYEQNDNSSQDGVSFSESPSYLLIQSQPELMLSYVCLVEKALNKLGILLPPHQNQKLIQGVWNILVKFWSDDVQNIQYQHLNAKIQWGLFQLLNFDLKVSKKQRVLMQMKINQGKAYQ